LPAQAGQAGITRPPEFAQAKSGRHSVIASANFGGQNFLKK